MIQEELNNVHKKVYFNLGHIPTDPDADWSYMPFTSLEEAKKKGEFFITEEEGIQLNLLIRFGLGGRMYAIPYDEVGGFELAVTSYGRAYNSNHVPDEEIVEMNKSFLAHFEKYEIQPYDSFQRTS